MSRYVLILLLLGACSFLVWGWRQETYRRRLSRQPLRLPDTLRCLGQATRSAARHANGDD